MNKFDKISKETRIRVIAKDLVGVPTPQIARDEELTPYLVKKILNIHSQ